jgi:hypothetical protein
MKFFSYFPTVEYGFQNSNGQYMLSMVNQTAHVRIVEALKKSITVFHDYVIQNDDRPDTVSVNLYGTPDYTWIVLMLNNIFSLYDWPLTNDEFDSYIVERYGSVTAAKALLRYRTFDNYYVDEDTWDALTVAQRGLAQTTYDFEVEANDAKRRLRVVPAEFVAPLAKELKKVMNS